MKQRHIHQAIALLRDYAIATLELQRSVRASLESARKDAYEGAYDSLLRDYSTANVELQRRRTSELESALKDALDALDSLKRSDDLARKARAGLYLCLAPEGGRMNWRSYFYGSPRQGDE